MPVTPTGLRTAPDSQPTAQPSSATPTAAAARAEVLITTQQVLFGAAVAQGTRRAPLVSRIGAVLRRMAADANTPRRPHPPKYYGYIEEARMAREMDRL
ncbi:hypothetical protein [Mycobacterium arosiense]|uniref:Uncharacterized protein n=1 Tax=Mycobacterium arosiense ATCC BAA-1401 = DSM 45069 TaxID=1265311 RepID=A0A1W9ZK22_MYCAI|nr:hypothetical protein [Mycobacterium arosiense]ORA16579.1 hypothetical protein BST14_10165 [Mycobacterium arosiense ATCC BAA-1401 = DSM 45069]